MRKKDTRSEVPSPWTHRDDVLLYACRIAALVHERADLSQLPQVLAPFPTSLGADERLWVSAPFVLRDHRALGDGSWSAPSVVVGGTGALGMGMLAGSMIGNVSARNRARDRAAADAVPRWVMIESGTLFLSGCGFYMYTPAVFPWPWQEITSAMMVGPGSMHLTGNSTAGPVSWLLDSDWSELVFVLWALARHPAHPQLLDGGWLPPGWVRWAAAHRRPVPGSLPGLDRGV